MDEEKWNGAADIEQTSQEKQQEPEAPKGSEAAGSASGAEPGHAKIQTAHGDKEKDGTIKIVIGTEKYDWRRFGFPWIARVDFCSPDGEFSWGMFSRKSVHHGDVGTLTVMAEEGDIVVHGQKGRGINPARKIQYSVVTADGTLQPLRDKGEARRIWLKKHSERIPLQSEDPW